MNRVIVTLDDNHYKALGELAKSQGMSEAGVLRQALRLYQFHHLAALNSRPVPLVLLKGTAVGKSDPFRVDWDK